MKTWITKWRISHALDERRALPSGVARAVASSPELHRFAADAGAVDRAFKNSRPAMAAPAGLHASIMHAVRARRGAGVSPASFGGVSPPVHANAPRRCLNPQPGRLRYHRAAQTDDARGWENFWLRLLPATALAALILFTVWGIHFVRPPTEFSHAPAASPLAVAHSALATGGDWIQAVPAAALSPLSEEMIRLNRDLTNAQNYLLASLP